MSGALLPQRIDTERLVLRRPRMADAEPIFVRYASDEAVTKFMSWPTHHSVETTEKVVADWIAQWEQEDRGGPYVIEAENELIGCTGFERSNDKVASTGYVFAQECWGKGYASEALGALVDLARQTGVMRLFAYCHHEHVRSTRVMEKNGFEFEGLLRNYIEFPNLSPGTMTDVLMYSWVPDDDRTRN